MARLLMVESWLQSTGIVLPALIRERGHEYVLVTRDPSRYAGHPALDEAADLLIAETNDPSALEPAVRSFPSSVDGVLTTCDYYLEAAARCAAALGLPGPNADVMRTAIRKDLVRDATSRAGLSSPRHVIASTWEECLAGAVRVGYPCVLKPVDLNSGTSVHPVADETALKDAFTDVTAGSHNSRGQPLAGLALIEEYLEGPEVSVEAATVAGRTHVLGITDKVVDPETLVERGHRFPALLGEGEWRSVAQHVTDALAAIGFTHGVSHTEVRLTAEGPRLVEINPRQCGGYIFELVELVTGASPLGMVIDLALGAQPCRGRHTAVPGAAVSFFLPGSPTLPSEKTLAADPLVRRWELAATPVPGAARDNNDRLGYVITVGEPGRDALEHAMSITAGRKRDQCTETGAMGTMAE